MKNVALARTSESRFVAAAKAVVPPLLWQFLYRLLVVGRVDHRDRYRPFYSPWLEPRFLSEFEAVRPYTLCSRESCWVLSNLLEHAIHVDGDVIEAGVFRGGTALLLWRIVSRHEEKSLHLFDSFEGMYRVDAGRDRHREGDFRDVSLEGVRSVVGSSDRLVYRKGWIPDTFQGLEMRRFCFAHVDLDLYQSVLDCCSFIYPRLSKGGVMVFDDYGYPSCPGALLAVTEFFSDKPETPLALQTGQAVVHKL